jgi:MinD-like ATPase involved in chromosome partitioning or flagellar assembly
VTVVAIVGDATTTTAVAIAAGWPTDRGNDVVVLEADPHGGSLAGWLDTPAQPSLATIVANAGIDAARSHRTVLDTVDAMTRRSDSGVRFISNAVRTRAAHRAVEEAALVVVPALAGAPTVVLADVGRLSASDTPSPAIRAADVVLIVHRQAAASASAATVRIERLVESVEELAHLDATFVLAVIGRSPFDSAEIGQFVGDAVPGTLRHTVALSDDPLAAATLAGRSGVSAKRLRRLPLMRDAARLAGDLADLLASDRAPGTTRDSARRFESEDTSA